MKKIIILVVLMMTIIVANATNVKIRFDNVGNNSTHKPCGDSLVLYKPDLAVTTIIWNLPGIGSIYGGDSIIITGQINGRITFYSVETNIKAIYVYSATTLPVRTLTDATYCSLGFAHFVSLGNPYCSYIWSDGNVNQVRSFDTFGSWTATITNGCGSTRDSIRISYYNPNPKPNLGADRIICPGTVIILDPGNPGIYTSHFWPRTGHTTSTDTARIGLNVVEVIDTSGCLNADSMYVTEVLPLPQNLCNVTFGDTTEKNELYWAVDPAFLQARLVVIIIRDTLDNLVGVDTVSYSTGKWVDWSSNPQDQAYQYTLRIIDSCGNVSDTSRLFTTIRLTKAYSTGEIDFLWTKPTGRSVAYYTLNGIRANSSIKYIATIAATFNGYNYINPDTSLRKYYVAYNVETCSTRTNVRSTIEVKSNYAIVKTTGIEPLDKSIFRIYPNPVSDKLFIQSPIAITAKLMDLTGKTLIYTKIQNNYIDVFALPTGIYMILLHDQQGNYLTRKITKQ